jgi:hypothetical protein
MIVPSVCGIRTRTQFSDDLEEESRNKRKKALLLF